MPVSQTHLGRAVLELQGAAASPTAGAASRCSLCSWALGKAHAVQRLLRAVQALPSAGARCVIPLGGIGGGTAAPAAAGSHSCCCSCLAT